MSKKQETQTQLAAPIVDGELAYNIYRRAMAEQSVGTDPWGALDEEDRVAWQAVADHLWTASA